MKCFAKLRAFVKSRMFMINLKLQENFVNLGELLITVNYLFNCNYPYNYAQKKAKLWFC